MRIYLDACCVNRLTDDQSQKRIREESEAIERILSTVRRGASIWVGSEVLDEEIESCPLPERKWENRAVLALASELIETDARLLERVQVLQSAGYGAFDALHLSSAESGRADVLLTTDDKFVRRAARGRRRASGAGAKSLIMVQGRGRMIAVDKMTDAEFENAAFDLLRREMGADGLARFLRLHRSGHGDYTNERDGWQRDLSVDDIAEAIRLRRATKP